MGEAHHLNQTERVTLIKEARKALDAAGLESTPIMAGTGLGSTRATIEVTKEAAEAGADSAIIIASGCESFLSNERMNKQRDEGGRSLALRPPAMFESVRRTGPTSRRPEKAEVARLTSSFSCSLDV